MNSDIYNEYLCNLFSNKKVPHALIVESPDVESGYKYLLKLICILLCKSGNDTYCGNCESCIKVLNGVHSDVQTIVPIEDSKCIGVDQIRDLRQDVYIMPNEIDYKIYIIKRANCLTVEAQSAFIKILEDPPKNVIFVLLTEFSDALLKTVLSRCEIFKLYREGLENDSDVSELSKSIVEMSISGEKIETFKLISSMISCERMFFKDVIIDIIKQLILLVKENQNENIFLNVSSKIESLTEILDYCDKNVNLNLLINYLSMIM